MTIPLTIIKNSDPTCPTNREPIPTILAMPHKIRVMAHAHLAPLHNPYATAKYVNPIIKKTPASNIPRTGIKAKTVNPLNKDPMSPIAISIAIIVTLKGL